MPRDLIFVVKSTLPTLFIKMPFCHSELQKCHYWASNWPILSNDVEMMWHLSLTEYYYPSSKIASPKYLKIIKNENYAK